ncbi:AI-2E family transporter [Nocardia nova]|uniref:AI-2E family transporter n=1 Tax=Nocardia nova TaxID=37330 RepID=UPI000CEA59ED|nr:AI-2E family transporter [Nocardia nova]
MGSSADSDAERDPQGEPSVPEPIAAAERAASESAGAQHPHGRPGPRFDRNSPFVIGVTGGLGVLLAIGVVDMLATARQALVLVGVALFLAIGIEPLVAWLNRRRLPRWAAVAVVFGCATLLVAGFLAAAITPLVTQGGDLVDHASDRLHDLENQYPLIRSWSQRLHLDQELERGLTDNPELRHGLLGAGERVFGVLASALIVAVLTIYFSANFPRIRHSLYRFFPQSRRPRAILLGDAIFAKVGGYVLGNLLISLITAIATFIWLTVFSVPYPLILSVLVALLDLVPLIGSTVAGLIITAVALTVSLPVSIATAGFFLAMRLLEDYLLVPRIMDRTVRVPAVVTVVAIILGGALLGILGALLAIPCAAAVLLIVQEVVYPHLDGTTERPPAGSGA